MNTPLSLAHLPDHTQLPDKDGKPVRNDLENPQNALLTETIMPHLKRHHPDGRFWIAQDCGIYWRLTVPPEPQLQGAVSPDWYYIRGVRIKPAKGLFRRSYVLWKEKVIPLLGIEYASGDGSEERDQTEMTGKFWIYEQGIGIPYYAIYEVEKASVEVHHLVKKRYRRLRPNARGHFPIKEMAAELGIWRGVYLDRDLPWLRWYDANGLLLPTNEELKEQALRQAEQEKRDKEQALRRFDAERRRAERLAEKLRALGVDPDA
jgi:Uma2 family endonuclease